MNSSADSVVRFRSSRTRVGISRVNLSRLALHSYCRVMYRPSYTCMRGRLVHRTSSMGRSHSGAHAPCNVTQGLGYIYSGKAHNRQLLLGSLQTLDVVHKFLLATQLSIGGKTYYWDTFPGYYAGILSWILIWDTFLDTDLGYSFLDTSLGF